MPAWAVALIVVLAVFAIGAGIWIFFRRRSERLRGRFGPEYDRLLREEGNQWRAEAALQSREKRVERLHIRPLAPEAREHFAETWHEDQALFVDDPESAVMEADRLVTEVMKERGYPVSDFEQRVEDISVDHPHVVDNYRAAAEIAERQKEGRATTEDLRNAMVYYRALFDDLLEMHEMRR